jgi:hypothetical protein
MGLREREKDKSLQRGCINRGKFIFRYLPPVRILKSISEVLGIVEAFAEGLWARGGSGAKSLAEEAVSSAHE